jgi:AhpD family alkylhydroperoxidase
MARLDYAKLSTPAVHALYALEKAVKALGVDPAIYDLVRIRASQLNGCIFCLDMHVKEATLRGERALRLHHLTAWRESALFSEKERAALEWTELLTRPGPNGVEDGDYEKARAQFSEKELSDLTLVISTINAWNRLGIAFRATPGSSDKMLGLDKAGLV